MPENVFSIQLFHFSQMKLWWPILFPSKNCTDALRLFKYKIIANIFFVFPDTTSIHHRFQAKFHLISDMQFNRLSWTWGFSSRQWFSWTEKKFQSVFCQFKLLQLDIAALSRFWFPPITSGQANKKNQNDDLPNFHDSQKTSFPFSYHYFPWPA